MSPGLRARNYLRLQQSFIWNATNVTHALRSQHQVPPAVIEKLAGKLELPDRTEAHEVIWIEH